MNYANARSVFINKWGRYSLGEKIALLYCLVVGALLIISPIVTVTPIDDITIKTYRLINPYLAKSAILIFGSRAALLARSTSYRWKAFVHQSIGFKENESLFSLFLLLVLTTAYIAIGDMALLLKSNITYTLKLSPRYFTTSIILVIGIVYTLRRGIMHAKRLAKSSVMSAPDHHKQEDIDSFKEHISSPDGLF